MDDHTTSRRAYLRGGLALATLGGCLGRDAGAAGGDVSEPVPAAAQSNVRTVRADGTSAPRSERTDVNPTTAEETEAETETAAAESAARLTGVRGAIYFPVWSANHYQTWVGYDPAAVERDLGYAASLGVNALRTFVSYERWTEDAADLERWVDHLLGAAADRGIRILPMLFESIGEQPTPANRARDVALRSPAGGVMRDRSKWEGPRRFVRWFASRYAGHEGLLALEIMNEPGEWETRVAFCREMLRAARDAAPSVPLTMGCKGLEYNRLYEDPGLDVLQFHYNVPPTAAHMREALAEAAAVSRETGKPVWLTEWQRTREEPPNKMLPNYSSLASVIRESDVDGDFFWQLMLKPAYITTQRERGRVNGVFHADGRVHDAGDADALRGGRGDSGEWVERPVRPGWDGAAGGTSSDDGSS